MGEVARLEHALNALTYCVVAVRLVKCPAPEEHMVVLAQEVVLLRQRLLVAWKLAASGFCSDVWSPTEFEVCMTAVYRHL